MSGLSSGLGGGLGQTVVTVSVFHRRSNILTHMEGVEGPCVEPSQGSNSSSKFGFLRALADGGTDSRGLIKMTIQSKPSESI